ncbi:MAG: tRNA (adenosine(37)-N6)-threonylcarbamoyltransferase complex ATPase subunit type 1 TsaE [Acidiferrobacterales bacterium]|nr:tRNA (adenosine(37)-N6)-threonylcarbamoyltransferase complex ATPase subunit type 1 TsaE [Acidiferrobacterales bacterium]
MSGGEAYQYQVPNERCMEQFGACFSPLIGQHVLLTLQGELGAGKTTLVRGLLRGAGYAGPVKSPTFSLVEPYEIGSSKTFHFDLYRLQDPVELEYIGIRDYLGTPALCVIEWPEKAGEFLPDGDIHIMIKRTGQGRELNIQALTERGQKAIRDNSLPDCWSGAENEVLA